MAQSIRIKRRGLAALKSRGFKIFQAKDIQEEYDEDQIKREIFKSAEEEEKNVRKRKA